MSNHYFQFKQFAIHQDKSAMKVSTDACIQGAWSPVKEHVKEVLDIGTGTGLLSLMLAQRNKAIHIDAIELDKEAAQQARENIEASAWKDNIQLIHADVRDYSFAKRYDMVICNPPFFNNSLLGSDDSRNNVRHTLSLSYQHLFEVIEKVLKPKGYASIMLPPDEHLLWAKILAANNWGIEKVLEVKPRAEQMHNRVVSVCVPYTCATIGESLQIYNADKSYTQQFADLLKAYYLYL